jgi:hypothetical protein
METLPMPRYFVQYWKNEQWEIERERMEEDSVLDHTAGNELRSKKVQPGDCVYIVTVIRGELFLAGRIEVDQVVSQHEAERLLEYVPYEAKDHLLARAGGETFDFDRPVPAKVTKQLLFVHKRLEPRPPVFRHGKLDRQTLQRVRELTPESAELLDRIIDGGE